MASTRELRRRIKSVKNTSQITKAMQMVAATKMKRAQNQALLGRPYSETLSSSIASLLPRIDLSLHPLLLNNEVSQSGVLLLSTNKALCGALNTNLFRAVQGHSGVATTRFFTVGLKGRDFAIKNNFTLEADFENPEMVMFARAKKIAGILVNLYLEKVIGEIYLAYPHFVSTLKQEPRISKILPIEYAGGSSEGSRRMTAASNASEDVGRRIPELTGPAKSEFIFEPAPDDLLDDLLTHQIETQIYQALLETKASEHSARMMAMQNATDNASELVEKLNLTYNKTRQSAITSELLEITSAQLALE